MLKASFGWLNHWRTNMVLVPNLYINPCYILRYTVVIPLLNPCFTLATSLLHLHYTLVTSLLHPCYILVTPLLHPSYNLVTSLLYLYYILVTPLLHPCYNLRYTIVIPLFSSIVTPLLHPCCAFCSFLSQYLSFEIYPVLYNPSELNTYQYLVSGAGAFIIQFSVFL